MFSRIISCLLIPNNYSLLQDSSKLSSSLWMAFHLTYICTIDQDHFTTNLTIYLWLTPSITIPFTKTNFQILISRILSTFDEGVCTATLTRTRSSACTTYTQGQVHWEYGTFVITCSLTLFYQQGQLITQQFQLRISQHTNDILFTIVPLWGTAIQGLPLPLLHWRNSPQIHPSLGLPSQQLLSLQWVHPSCLCKQPWRERLCQDWGSLPW